LPPEPAGLTDDDELKRERLAAALLGFVAAVQLLVMVIRWTDAIALFWHLALGVPAAAFALAWWRGRRPRVASIALALIWSVLNTGMAVQLVRSLPAFATQTSAMNIAIPSLPRWFIPLFTATSISFSATTIVIVTGRPTRGRRIAGAALGAVFALLFIAEHLWVWRG
jgi:hypothetical protein